MEGGIILQCEGKVKSFFFSSHLWKKIKGRDGRREEDCHVCACVRVIALKALAFPGSGFAFGGGGRAE